MPMARMEFASFCLDNALLCLDTSTKIPFDTAATAHCPPSKQDNNDARLVVCCWLDSLFWFLAVVQILESGFVYLLNSIYVWIVASECRLMVCIEQGKKGNYTCRKKRAVGRSIDTLWILMYSDLISELVVIRTNIEKFLISLKIFAYRFRWEFNVTTNLGKLVRLCMFIDSKSSIVGKLTYFLANFLNRMYHELVLTDDLSQYGCFTFAAKHRHRSRSSSKHLQGIHWQQMRSLIWGLCWLKTITSIWSRQGSMSSGQSGCS